MSEDTPGEKDAMEPSAAPEEPGEDKGKPKSDRKTRIARIATAAVLFAVAGTEFASVILIRNLVIDALWAIFGFIALVTGIYLYRGSFTAWGAAATVNGLGYLLAIVTQDLIVGVTLLVSHIVLYYFRLSFGVGAWKIEAAGMNKETRALIAERTRNPAGIRCPKCGADTLWLADDGSAFCLTCRAGTIELARREPS